MNTVQTRTRSDMLMIVARVDQLDQHFCIPLSELCAGDYVTKPFSPRAVCQPEDAGDP
jgi:DNA-binding response OmpR family regulator